MRIAYADPPYIGQAKKHYGEQTNFAGEVDHKALLERLNDEFPDGWALSASSVSLWVLIPMIPISWGCRIGVWAKPFCSFKPGVNPAYAWEPVIWKGGRKRERSEPTVRDFVIKGIEIKKGLPGAKPDEFCYWLFDLLNMRAGDELVDLFPGTGRVMRAWKIYSNAGMELFREQTTVACYYME